MANPSILPSLQLPERDAKQTVYPASVLTLELLKLFNAVQKA